MIRTASAAALLALSLGLAAGASPAQARLADPDSGSVIGGGLFGGVRLGPRTARLRADERASEVVGETCYIRAEQGARPSSADAARRPPACE
jgi:hypothetical protein